MMMIHSGDAVGCEGGVDVPCWRVERRGGCGVFVRVHFVFGEKKREKNGLLFALRGFFFFALECELSFHLKLFFLEGSEGALSINLADRPPPAHRVASANTRSHGSPPAGAAAENHRHLRHGQAPRDGIDGRCRRSCCCFDGEGSFFFLSSVPLLFSSCSISIWGALMRTHRLGCKDRPQRTRAYPN